MQATSLYREDLAYIHDIGHGDIARSAAERLVKELRGNGIQNGTVADIGCGSGILAGHLSEAGYRVMGIDVSEAMVAIARNRVSEANFSVCSFVTADLPRSVAVTAIGEVLNYAFDEGNDSRTRNDFYGRAYEALMPGGLLLFDMADSDRAVSDGRHRTFTEGPDWAVLVQTEFDRMSGVLTRNITSFREVEGVYRRDTETHRLVLVDPSEVLESLRSSGFEAQTLPGYGHETLPVGVVVFVGRKPLRDAPSRDDEAGRR